MEKMNFMGYEKITLQCDVLGMDAMLLLAQKECTTSVDEWEAL